MLTGKRLFYGESDYQTVELVRAARIPPIGTQNPEVEPELEEIVRKSLARRADDRFQSATDLQDALAQYLFSRGLKMIQRDISELVRGCLEDQAGISGASRKPRTNIIDTLLQDEIQSFTSVDFQDGGDEAGPARPPGWRRCPRTPPANTSTRAPGPRTTTSPVRRPTIPPPSPRRARASRSTASSASGNWPRLGSAPDRASQGRIWRGGRCPGDRRRLTASSSAAESPRAQADAVVSGQICPSGCRRHDRWAARISAAFDKYCGSCLALASPAPVGVASHGCPAFAGAGRLSAIVQQKSAMRWRGRIGLRGPSSPCLDLGLGDRRRRSGRPPCRP
jgi:hypothetical protein